MRRSYTLLIILYTFALVFTPADPLFAQDEVQKDFNGQAYDTAPKPINMPPPVYPEQAKADSIEGLVVLLVTIDVDGSTSAISIQRSLRKDLDDAARAAVRKTVWEPARLKGKPVKIMISFPIRFKLR